MKGNPDLRAAIRALVRDAAREAPNASLDELNRRLGRRVDQYNLAPQAELGGLSPEQMSRLLYEDWSGNGLLRLKSDLVPYELDTVDILHNARVVLGRLGQGPLKQTQAGNLARVEVMQLLPQLRVNFDAERFLAVSRVINEYDVQWLHVLRHVLVAGGLVMRRKGFRITRLGRTYMPEARMGALYALLFETLFRKIDLRAIDMFDHHAGLQGTVAYSFFQLRSAAADWASPERLAEEAWLERAKDPMTPSELQFGDLRPWTFQRRVLTPLVMFGLLEECALPAEDKWSRPVEFRKTPLFDRFLKFGPDR